MYEKISLNPDFLTAEVAYRRSQLTRPHAHPPQPRGRWWQRRSTRTV